MQTAIGRCESNTDFQFISLIFKQLNSIISTEIIGLDGNGMDVTTNTPIVENLYQLQIEGLKKGWQIYPNTLNPLTLTIKKKAYKHTRMLGLKEIYMKLYSKIREDEALAK